MLNPSSGISAFVDNLIVISAARYGATISEDASDEPGEQWHLVSLAVQSVLRHPHNDDERLMLQHIEVSKFNAEVCHHRAAYLLWKAKRAEANGPSRFNITRDSLTRDIHLLYASVKQNLPSISADADDSALEEVHTFACKTEEDVRRDQMLAEAEDDFMRKVQDLQSEFYAKHKKWIDVPISLTPSKPDATAARQPAATSAHSSCGKLMTLEQLDTAGVAQLLVDLDIGEHKEQFRRTTGKLLAQIAKSDLRERFNGDKEAADILWAFIEKNRVAKSDGPSSGSLEKVTPSRAVAPKSVEAEQVEKLFAAFCSPDPFASLKRAMNPDRPLRPSDEVQPDFEMTEAETRAMEDTYIRATAQAQSAASSKPSGKVSAAKPTTAAASSKPAVSESSAPLRSNRWQVVEYDDDEDEDDS
jgi:hypothetical protein